MASNMVQQSSPERKLTYCAERNQKFVEFQRKCTEKLLRWSSWIRKKFFQVFRSNTTELCNTEHQKTSKYIKILLIISIVYYYILYDSRRYYYHILYWPLSAIFCEPRAALRLCAEALQALAKVSHLAVVTLPRHPKISEVIRSQSARRGVVLWVSAAKFSVPLYHVYIFIPTSLNIQVYFVHCVSIEAIFIHCILDFYSLH
jgi:hypothetical protein